MHRSPDPFPRPPKPARKPSTSHPAFRAPWDAYPENHQIGRLWKSLSSLPAAGVCPFTFLPMADTCCGTPFSSKGLSRAHEIAINAAIERCWGWSEQGTLPIVIDTSPCTYGFRTASDYLTEENRQRFAKMRFLDSIEFVHDELLLRLPTIAKTGHAACRLLYDQVGADAEARSHRESLQRQRPRSA